MYVVSLAATTTLTASSTGTILHNIRGTTPAFFETPVAEYGSINDVYGFSTANSGGAGLSATFWTHAIVSGQRLGKGMVAALEFTNANVGTVAATNSLTNVIVPATIFRATSTGRSYLSATGAGIREIRSPTGGVM